MPGTKSAVKRYSLARVCIDDMTEYVLFPWACACIEVEENEEEEDNDEVVKDEE